MADILTNAVNKVVNTGVDLAANPLFSASSFAWNGKDLRRNVRYQKKMIRFQNAQNREQASWSAREMPSLQMAGLRRAGLNPILAVTGSGGFHTDSANSAASVSLPSGESYVNNQTSPAPSDGNFVDEIGQLWDSVSNFFSDRFIRKESKEVAKDKLKAEKAESKARAARAETDKLKAEEEKIYVKSNIGDTARRLRGEADLAEHNATTAGLKAWIDQQRQDFLTSWLANRLPFDEAVRRYIKVRVGHGGIEFDPVIGDDNELFRLMMSSWRNQMRREDWQFFNDQLNAGVNAATTVGNAMTSGLSNLLRAFKYGKKKK